MGRSTGSADLPLHGGRVPPWLATRMAKLGRIITEAIIVDAGRDEWLRRMAHPFWFQSFGAVMGMDWHSSGITTSVMGALKRGLAPVQSELGIYVCGGRGRHSRRTPDELMSVGERTGLPGDALAKTSRLVAKVDSAAVQDGFELYLHSFVVVGDGKWTVVQQGMNGGRRQARRYHWLSENVSSFVDEPHAAIDGPNQGTIINLTDRRAEASRAAQLDLIAEGPERVLATVRRFREQPAPAAVQESLPHLSLPAHHDVRESDVVLRRLHGALCAAADRGPKDFPTLLMTPGVGARTIASLAMVGEVIYGAPHRFSDPGRFSYAHGGKDGHPFPVPLDVYDQTIRVLKDAVGKAKLGNDERLSAIRRLDQQARNLEDGVSGPSWSSIVKTERRESHRYGGRTVFGAAKPPRPTKPTRKGPTKVEPSDDQLDIFGGPRPQKT